MNVLRKGSPGFFKLNENAYRYRFRRGKRIRDPKRVEKVRETGIGEKRVPVGTLSREESRSVIVLGQRDDVSREIDRSCGISGNTG